MYFTQHSSMATSVPERMGSHTSARAASTVKRGSTTTVLQPAARRSAMTRPPPGGVSAAGWAAHTTTASIFTSGLYISKQFESAIEQLPVMKSPPYISL